MKQNRSAAFTLIELVAACAIAAVLMAGAFMVLCTMLHDRQRMQASQLPEGASTGALLEFLRSDIAEATTFNIKKNELTLRTCHMLEKNLTITDRPVQVIYRIAKCDGGACLVRRQVVQDDPMVPRPQSTLLAIGIQSWKIQPLLEVDDKSKKTDEGIGDPPPPRRLRVQMRFEDAKQNIDQVICLR